MAKVNKNLSNSVIYSIFKRELLAYFYSPVAYVFISIFVFATAASAIFLGRIFDSNNASLDIIFGFMPWILLLLVPAVGMQLWSEEKNSGSIELLLTLPVSIWQVVIGKFLAGWTFLGFALFMTFLFPITIFILGSPDILKILVGYFGTILLAGAYLSISAFTSAFTKKQIISFIFSFIICFMLAIIGWGVFSDLLNNFLPPAVGDFVASFGVVAQYENFIKGLIDIKNVSYYIILILGCLALNVRILKDMQYK